MRYWVSDIHDFHANAIKYCNRPFANVNEMHEFLVYNWNNKVKDGDQIYVLGDISLNPNVACHLGSKLKGELLCVPGNHDGCYNFPKRSQEKIAKMKHKYECAGWKILDKQVKLTLKNNLEILMCHFPYASTMNQGYDQRYHEERPKDEGMILVHGHLHNRYLKNGRMIDVGWDHNFDLMSEDQLIELINDKRDFIKSRITDFYKEREAQNV